MKVSCCVTGLPSDATDLISVRHAASDATRQRLPRCLVRCCVGGQQWTVDGIMLKEGVIRDHAARGTTAGFLYGLAWLR